MKHFLEIATFVLVAWVSISIVFAVFWSVLKRREPEIEEPEDAFASDS